MRGPNLATMLALGLAMNLASWMIVPVIAQQPTVQRKVLLTQDLPIPTRAEQTPLTKLGTRSILRRVKSTRASTSAQFRLS